MGKKKEKYIPKVGITGLGEDYNIYVLSLTERIIGFAIGFVAGYIAMHIMFGVVLVSLISGVLVGFVAVPIFRNYLFKKRKKQILLQFRDVLDSLSNSFSSGKNTPAAFNDAYSDLRMAYGEKAVMVQELSIVLSGLHNNYIIEDLLKDMAVRCGLDDINSFAETFAVCNRLGGNLKKIVSESRDIISDKIEIEMEIQTTVASSKNDINIMSVMPFVVVAMMGTMGNEAITGNNFTNVIVKIIALVLFAAAYKVGCMITDIKV